MKIFRKILYFLILVSVIGSLVTFGVIYATDKDSLSSGYSIKKNFDVNDASGIVIDANTRLAFGKIGKNEQPYAEFEYKSFGITAIGPIYELIAKREGILVKVVLRNRLPTLVTVGSTETKLTVYLPEVMFETAVVKCGGLDDGNGLIDARSLSLNVKDANIDLKNTYEVLKINTGDGDIRVSSDISSELDVFTHYGNIELTGSYSLIKAESDDGDIRIRNDIRLEFLSASTDDGNIELTIPRDITGLELNYDLYDGKLTSDFDLDIKSGDGRQKGTAYFGDRSVKVKAATREGNIVISKD